MERVYALCDVMGGTEEEFACRMAEVDELEFDLMSVPVTDPASAVMRLRILLGDVEESACGRRGAPVSSADTIAEVIAWLEPRS